MQLRELREYISRRDWKNGGEYIDTGFSGAKASRPALDHLMADAARHKFDCIAVYKLDRFGRSVLHLTQQLAALKSCGIRFVAISQGLDTDQSNPTASLLFHILSAVAEFERSIIKERTLSGIRAAKAAGITETVKLGGSGWVAARALGPSHRAVTDDYAFAQTSPVYIVRDGRPFVLAKDAQFLDEMLTALWWRIESRRFVSAADRDKVRDAVEAAHRVYRERATQATAPR